MSILDFIYQFIEKSNISKAFGIDVNSFLILISGSFIVGYICLTLYYMVYNDGANNKWKELNFSEKAIVSLAIGFVSILPSILIVHMYQSVINNDKNIEQFYYIYPFIYFIMISGLVNKIKNYREMKFIKVYLQVSVICIICLTIIFSVPHIIQSWYVMLMLIFFILIICLKFKKKIIEIYYLFNVP